MEVKYRVRAMWWTMEAAGWDTDYEGNSLFKALLALYKAKKECRHVTFEYMS